jgi:hypothetical protein
MLKYPLKWHALMAIIMCVAMVSCNAPKPREEKPQYPPTNQNRDKSPAAQYDALLRKHVNRKGDIHYKGFQADSIVLNSYLSYMAGIESEDPAWADTQRLVYWINLYNAWVINLVIRDYPVVSIAEVRSPRDRIETLTFSRDYGPQTSALFDLKVVKTKGGNYSLNEVKSLIRKRFADPRIHFALVDGIMSAPKLRRARYTSMELPGQLEHAALEFFELPGKNFINPQKPQLSPIFRDYAEDFTQKGTLMEFINTYSKVKIRPDAEMKYLDYDWQLNGY